MGPCVNLARPYDCPAPPEEVAMNMDFDSGWGDDEDGGDSWGDDGDDEDWKRKKREAVNMRKEKFRENAPTSNPFAAAPDSGPEETPNILDLFGVGGGQADTAPAAPSDDLLQLQGNPFANMMNGEQCSCNA